MPTSDTSTKAAARSTSAAAPAASQAEGDDSALQNVGAPRGDIFDINAALMSELGSLSESHSDNDDDPAQSEKSARLDDTEATGSDAAPAAESDEAAADDEAETAAEGEEAAAQSDDAKLADDSPESKPESDETKPEAKRDGRNDRIDELTGRLTAATSELAAAREQLAAYRARDEGTLTPEALDHVESRDDLQKAQQRYSALLQWAIRNPEGGKLGDRDYTADEVRALHAEVQSLVTEAVPARREYLAKREEADREAVNFYPWLKDTTRGAGQLVQQAVAQIPAIRRLPNYRMIAADALVGQSMRQAGIRLTDTLLKRLAAEVSRSAPAAKPGQPAKPAAAAKPKPPAAPGRAGVLPARLEPRAAQAKAAQQRLRSSQGSEDDVAAFIASKL